MHIKELFEKLLDLENHIAITENQKKVALAKIESTLAVYNKQYEDVYGEVEKWIKDNPQESINPDTGELASCVFLPSADPLHQYKIFYAEGRESVKTGDVESIPDEYVRIKKEPKKVAIAKFLKDNKTPVNWASLERGERKLQWKLVKKS